MTEIVYLGHNNEPSLILKKQNYGEASAAENLASVTRMTLSFNKLLISSTNLDTGPIRWNKAGYATGEVRVFLGDKSIPPRTYQAPLIVYDPSHPDGIVWGIIPIQIIEEVEAPTPTP